MTVSRVAGDTESVARAISNDIANTSCARRASITRKTSDTIRIGIEVVGADRTVAS